ncbi:MAG: hypothetical protein LC768_18815, partial [Acidobacteria bacterium]|nr:hypothetical protein [Acidobacteriota bacterium]
MLAQSRPASYATFRSKIKQNKTDNRTFPVGEVSAHCVILSLKTDSSIQFLKCRSQSEPKAKRSAKRKAMSKNNIETIMHCEPKKIFPSELEFDSVDAPDEIGKTRLLTPTKKYGRALAVILLLGAGVLAAGLKYLGDDAGRDLARREISTPLSKESKARAVALPEPLPSPSPQQMSAELIVITPRG